MSELRKYYELIEGFFKKFVSRKLVNKDISLIQLINTSTKILFIIIPAISGIVTIIFYLSVYSHYNSMKNNMLNIIEVGFSENLKSAMNTNDFLQVRNSLEEIRKLNTIESVILVDKRQKVIIDDDMKKEGQFLDIKELSYAFNEQFKDETIKKNNKLILLFENESSCRRCHMEDEQVLGGLVITFNSFDDMNKMIIYFVVISVFGMLIIFFAKVFFSTVSESYLNTPINTLMEVSKDIFRGEGIVKKEIKSPVEFKYIFNTLSKMAEDIDEYVQEIKQKNSEKDQIKILAGIGEMAAKVAHEVRNPLNTIDGAIHYLKKTGVNQDSFIEYLDLIHENIHRINNVASELLDATRPSKPTLEKVSLVKLLRERIHDFSDQYINSKTEINFEAYGEIPIIFVDKHQIIQVIDNLLENAINAVEFNEKGIINIHIKKISPTPMQNFLLLRFFDNGCGIPPDNLNKIFIPFFTTKSRGTGLGLSIVEKIIINHRGEIRILSKLNKGTIVRVKLPLRT